MSIDIDSINIVIQPLEEVYLEEVVAVHQKVLGYTLSSRLGQEHLELLYSTMMKNSNSFVGIARFDSETIGFVSGTLNPESLKSQFFNSISMAYWIKLAYHFFFHPSLILDFWFGLQIEKPVLWGGKHVIPTLTTIGVDDRFQGSGIGRKLVKSLEVFFFQHQVPAYRLDTLRSNQNAREFYSKLGFAEVAERANSVILIKPLTE